MGFFDALSQGSFKRTEDGGTAFYPWRTLGAGYVLRDEEQYCEIRRFLRGYNLSLLVIILIGILLGWPKAFLPFLVLIGVYIFVVRRQLRGLAKTRERLTLTESYRQQAKAHNRALLWVFEVVSLLFTAAGVLILATSPTNWFAGIASVAFFGLCAVVFGFMIHAKRKDRSDHKVDR